jgi:hypothetical protein
MTRIIALKECPQGQLPGTEFDAPEAAAAVLVKVGAASYVDAPPAAEQPAAKASPRRRYHRRDLQAEE